MGGAYPPKRCSTAVAPLMGGIQPYWEDSFTWLKFHQPIRTECCTGEYQLLSSAHILPQNDMLRIPPGDILLYYLKLQSRDYVHNRGKNGMLCDVRF